MITILGIIGAVLLSVCSIPQLIKMISTKDVEAISLQYLLIWIFGMISMLVHLLMLGGSPLVIANYIVNIIVVMLMIIVYKLYKK